MKLSKPSLFYLLLGAALIIAFVLLMQPLSIMHFGESIVMLFPKGLIALEERNLLFIIQALMLLIIIPVYILTFVFSWKYRATRSDDTYDPDLVDNTAAEFVWWGVPLIMTLIVAGLAWFYTHQMDPFKPLQSDNKTIKIQVVALDWKWLFIYPEEKIATVNFIQIPKNTPVHFEITADAPMNSFWIPSLGSQIYAMPNMKTEVHLMADSEGDFRGCSANISGVGFAGMVFTTRASTEEEYRKWLHTAQHSPHHLGRKEYDKLALPSEYNPVEIYRLEDVTLFNQILMKFMQPGKPCLAD